MDNKNADFIDGLRKLIQFLEATPEFPQLYGVSPTAWPRSKNGLAEIARIPGGWIKDYTENYLTLKREFGGGVTVEATVSREKVCRKIVTGQKIVELPALEARPAETITVDVTEWVCDEAILADPTPGS